MLGEKKIAELEKALFQSSEISIRQKALLKRYLKNAKRFGDEFYQKKLLRYVDKYLSAIPTQGSIPGIKIEMTDITNVAIDPQGTVKGVKCRTRNVTDAFVGSQGTIKGIRHKRIGKGEVCRAIPPQGKIKGVR